MGFQLVFRVFKGFLGFSKGLKWFLKGFQMVSRVFKGFSSGF